MNEYWGEIFMGKISTFLFYRSFSCNSTLKITSQRNLNDQLYVNQFFVSSEGGDKKPYCGALFWAG